MGRCWLLVAGYLGWGWCWGSWGAGELGGWGCWGAGGAARGGFDTGCGERMMGVLQMQGRFAGCDCMSVFRGGRKGFPRTSWAIRSGDSLLTALHFSSVTSRTKMRFSCSDDVSHITKSRNSNERSNPLRRTFPRGTRSFPGKSERNTSRVLSLPRAKRANGIDVRTRG
jgi:hypothetical protein